MSPQHITAPLPVVPVPVRSDQRSVFKHVILIVKENHTYDDFFGDAPRGNGDSRFCAFPKRVSPNHHALAARFGSIDNFYVNADVSADGGGVARVCEYDLVL